PEPLPREPAGFDGVDFAFESLAQVGEPVAPVRNDDEGGGFAILPFTRLDQMPQIGGDGVVDETGTVPPRLGGKRASSGPALVGKIGDGDGERGVAARVETGDTMERAVEEDRLQDHLVPRRLAEMRG